MYSKYLNKHRPQISAAFGGGGVNKRRGAYLFKDGTKRYYHGINLHSQISAAFLEKKVNKRRGVNSRKFGTFPYAL